MLRFVRTGVAAAVAVLLVAAPVLAGDKKKEDPGQEELKQQIEALKQGQQEILKQLEEIKKLIPARPAPPAGPNVKDVVFSLGGNPIQGAETAKLILVEFTDYQCPFCSRHARETSPQVAREFIETGKIRYALLDYPLPMHPKAFDAAEAVRCAGDQGKFWEMHDRLFANQQALEPLSGHAEALGLKAPEFEECRKSDKHAEAIRADMKEAQKAGFSGTPSFMLALTDPKDPKKVKGLIPIVGAQPFAKFKEEIEKALAGN